MDIDSTEETLLITGTVKLYFMKKTYCYNVFTTAHMTAVSNLMLSNIFCSNRMHLVAGHGSTTAEYRLQKSFPNNGGQP